MLLLVAGEGRLPGIVAGALEAAGTPFRIAELEGHEMEGRGDRPVTRFRLERLGSFLKRMVEEGATEVCFAGAVRRPALDPALVDAETMPLVPRFMAALGQGDDGALRIVLSIFEEAGLTVRGAHEVAPDLLPAPGVPTERKPEARHEADAARGAGIAAALGAADAGQSCVVQGGQALALETVMGTDWMLNALAVFRMADPATAMVNADLRFLPGGTRLAPGLAGLTGAPHPDAMAFPEAIARGGLLFKAPKPGQDRRVDLPVIGEGTVRAAKAAALDGLVIEAGGVMVPDRDAVVRAADAAGLFLWVRPS